MRSLASTFEIPGGTHRGPLLIGACPCRLGFARGLPLLPIYQYVNGYAYDPDKVKNLYLTPRMMTMFKAIEVVK
ncbi:MAG: hypothetical protein IH898_03595 [Planctomycetes bacterium]|nr:hypothetical protein [Planctomycetota bacterium]